MGAPMQGPAAAPPAQHPSKKKPPTQGDSLCGPPMLVDGTNDTYSVSCLGPGIPLQPGQVLQPPVTALLMMNRHKCAKTSCDCCTPSFVHLPMHRCR